MYLLFTLNRHLTNTKLYFVLRVKTLKGEMIVRSACVVCPSHDPNIRLDQFFTLQPDKINPVRCKFNKDGPYKDNPK